MAARISDPVPCAFENPSGGGPVEETLRYYHRTRVCYSCGGRVAVYDDYQGRPIVCNRESSDKIADQIRCEELERLGRPIVVNYVPGLGRALRFDLQYLATRRKRND